MDHLAALPEGLRTSFVFLTSLAIGLLLGLERQRRVTAKAGLRTFALVALCGTVAGLLADTTGNSWIIPTGFALVGLMIIAAYRTEPTPEGDSGTTTVVAVLLCYGLGVMVWYGHIQLAATVGIVATLLLYFRTELHGFSEKLSGRDVASMLQFAVLSFIVLPLLPDRAFDPYDVLNPYHLWLMVVLISGVSLAGYLALRLIGPRRSVALLGAFGGLISSTATTLVYSRQAGISAATAPLGAAIIVVANLVVLLRLLVLSVVVAPAIMPQLAPIVTLGFAAGLVVVARQVRCLMASPDLEAPELSNPTNLRVALGFGALYTVVLLGAAWLSEHAGSHGLYAIALVSGLADVDAITLSTLNLFGAERLTGAVATTAITLAFLAAVAFKVAATAVLGRAPFMKRCLAGLLAPAAGVVAGLLIFR
jgi:uncharacterized membrane protein (DUF4010 family)